jgi:arsenite-transporting ATPase
VTASATPLEALLAFLPRTSLIVGKGGVGKTTCAAHIARAFAGRGERTLLVSTDPAAALADVLGAPVHTHAAPVPGTPRLDARQLAAAELRREFLERWRETIAEIIDRGTYLDRADVDGLVDAALPGADEIFALLTLADLLGDRASPYARLVVDTAPTGHTLRLLALPDTFRALLAMLDLMQNKHRFMVRALTHRYRRDAADDFLDTMRRRVDGLRAALANGALAAAVVVARAEPVVAAETARYVDALRALHMSVASLVINALPAERDASTERALDQIAAIDATIPRVWVPRWPAARRASRTPPRNAPPVSSGAPQETSHAPIVSLASLVASLVAPLVAPLTIVAGKGGVGKSTISCALAIAAADESAGSILLVSTDPAPSLADALGEGGAPWAARDTEHQPDGVANLVVRQMDATAAFAALRDEYQSRIDALFGAIVGRGVDVEHDRAILRELFALAPPGIDELLALSVLGEALETHRFARVVVDPAPTGHLLRLLDMPGVALEWTHRLMRLMLKYRDVVALGDSAQELLDFSRRVRAFDALLHDRERCALLVVALDEPVVRAESERLARAAAERGAAPRAVIWNRGGAADVNPLPAAPSARQFVAGERVPPPIGVTALRDWARSWRELSTP